jgi:hypothetical protein
MSALCGHHWLRGPRSTYLTHVLVRAAGIPRLLPPPIDGEISVFQCAQSAAVEVAWKNTSYLLVISGNNPWIWDTDEQFPSICRQRVTKWCPFQTPICTYASFALSFLERLLHIMPSYCRWRRHISPKLHYGENTFFRSLCFRCPTSTPEISATFTSDNVKIINGLGSTHHRVLACCVWSNHDTLRHSTV